MGEVEVSRRNGLYGFEFLEEDKRRVDRSEKKNYEIKSLWQRNHEIINLAVRGFKQTEIAEILNIHPQTVSNTLNSRLGELKTAEIRKSRDEEAKQVNEKIRIITDKALNIYHEIFDDDTDQVSLKDKGSFAEGFLKEMSGLRAPTRIQSHHVHTQLTAEEIESFKERGMQAARDSGLIVDVEDSSDSEKNV